MGSPRSTSTCGNGTTDGDCPISGITAGSVTGGNPVETTQRPQIHTAVVQVVENLPDTHRRIPRVGDHLPDALLFHRTQSVGMSTLARWCGIAYRWPGVGAVKQGGFTQPNDLQGLSLAHPSTGYRVGQSVN